MISETEKETIYYEIAKHQTKIDYHKGKIVNLRRQITDSGKITKEYIARACNQIVDDLNMTDPIKLSFETPPVLALGKCTIHQAIKDLTFVEFKGRKPLYILRLLSGEYVAVKLATLKNQYVIRNKIKDKTGITYWLGKQDVWSDLVDIMLNNVRRIEK